MAEWHWGPREDKAFGDVKTRLTHAPVMAYYRQGAPTLLTTDALPVGIGVILEQEQEDGSYRPIYYASHKLSKVENDTPNLKEKPLPSGGHVKSSTCIYMGLNSRSVLITSPW